MSGTMQNTPEAAAGSSLIDRIAADRPHLSKAFGKVADALLAGPAQFMALSIQEIALTAGVSEPSVVRFCRGYGFDGVPDFRIGLAMSLAADRASSGHPFPEPAIADKMIVNRKAKMAVAREAMKLIETDRSMILDSGSTLQFFAQNLRAAAGRTILTTGLNILETLWGCRDHTLILPGGIVRFDARALTGRMVEQALENMRFDTVYFGADSIDPDAGLSTFNEDEAHQDAAMARACSRVVVLVDSTKFKAPALHRFCGIDSIHTIVTDHLVPDGIAERLRAHGVNLLIANPLDEA